MLAEAFTALTTARTPKALAAAVGLLGLLVFAGMVSYRVLFDEG